METFFHVLEGKSPLMAFPNESSLDRAIRFIVGVVILGIGWFGPLDDLAGVAFRILGWYPLVTGLFGWSPLYAVLGWTTLTRRR